MTTCTSCGGAVEDGYCTVCGLAAAPAATVPGSASGRSSRRGRSSRGRLGAGIIEIPPVPYRDPTSAVLADPQVPEHRRFCGSCDQPVGRGTVPRAGLTEGYCRNCGTWFSFRPKLVKVELVAGQYEVLGCLAFGGLGWIYLARDRNVSDRWVVLMGLLNTGDADAMAAAVAEQQFLAQVEHPNIVRIYNFVQHADTATGEAAGYIVMEYVGGQSLKQILQDKRKTGGSVPVDHAIAYAIEVLPALGYLHDRGLVYCDFKPDNVIQTEEQIKLIDMGGVRAIDGDDPIYGTVGYQAPEIESDGPTPSSDLYTVGRALAVLTFEFAGYQGRFAHSLPDGVPLLAQQESFARLLRRATNPDPALRFGSADEMAEQLTGVLREVVAVARGTPQSAFSTVFSPELQAIGTQGGASGGLASTPPLPAGAPSPVGSPAALPAPPGAEIIGGLPMPQVNRTDPAAGYLATFATLDPSHRATALSRAVAGDGTIPGEAATSVETRLALARAMIDVGDYAGAADVLADLAADYPADWRIAWYTGLRKLGLGGAAAAGGAFGAVYDELPGELAPKLARAFAAEAAGDVALARQYFQLVWTVDRSYISAAFGLARTCLAGGDRPGAIAALAGVPETSSHHAAAQIAAIRVLVSPAATGAGVSDDDLRQAAGRLGRLSLDEARRQELTVEILRTALDWVLSGRAPGRHTGRRHSRGAAAAGEGTILGCEPDERALRLGLERGYRALASLTSDRGRRIELVDIALVGSGHADIVQRDLPAVHDRPDDGAVVGGRDVSAPGGSRIGHLATCRSSGQRGCRVRP